MSWVVAAEGTNFWNLRQTIEDFDLPKGTRFKVVFDIGSPWDSLFDAAGMELAFKPLVPGETKIIDVWGEDGQGIVELEAEGVWLTAIVGGLAAWKWILIGGVLLISLVSFITILVKVPAALQVPLWLILGAAGGILLLAYAGSRGTRSPP